MSINSRRGPKWKRTAEAIKQQYNYTCVYQWDNCTVDTDLTIDHIIPLDLFDKMYPGEDPDSEWNLTLACRRCNSKKKNNIISRQNWVDLEIFEEGLLR